MSDTVTLEIVRDTPPRSYAPTQHEYRPGWDGLIETAYAKYLESSLRDLSLWRAIFASPPTVKSRRVRVKRRVVRAWRDFRYQLAKVIYDFDDGGDW